MKIITLPIIAAAVILSGCESAQDAATDSGFASPQFDGTILGKVEIDGNRDERTVNDGTNSGFAIVSGSLDGGGFGAYVGLLPTTTVVPHGVTGGAVYDARYTLSRIDDINLTGNFIRAQSRIIGDDITLTADFADRTLTGTSDEGFLVVNGELNGNDELNGTVTYRDLRGTLRGVIGTDKVVGIFHANNADLIYAGGFIGDAQ
jgi:hypothetical protein